MTVYEYNQQILIVDAGMMFPDNDMIGIDYIIPDFEYVKQRANQVKGIVITHGHEDHTGAIGHLLEYVNAPVYATPLTNGLIKNKLNRRGMKVEPKLIDVSAGESLQIGPFKVDFSMFATPFPMASAWESIPLPVSSFTLATTSSTHTPIDGRPTDYSKLAEFARRGVLALLADSTNAERPGWTASERVINDAFDKVFYQAKGRIIIATFASLISRMQQVLDTAKRHDRKVSFVGLSMTDNARIAKELGYLNYDEKLVVSTDQALSMPDGKVVLW